ncbi:hypothetical protein ABVT39_016215, partial [Epinephelus coioides]
NAVAWRPRRKCAAINCQEQLENMQAQPYQWQPQFFALVDGGGGRSGVGETL